jgi:hypothetical protein
MRECANVLMCECANVGMWEFANVGICECGNPDATCIQLGWFSFGRTMCWCGKGGEPLRHEGHSGTRRGVPQSGVFGR